ncbi:PQQ-dependent sugar dehydrogenase, partial [Streptomyces violascens]
VYRGGIVSPAPGGLRGGAPPGWWGWGPGSFGWGSVWGRGLWRVPLDGTKPLADPEAFLTGQYGRLRTVLPAASSGKLWLLTNNTDSRGKPKPGDDRILELDVR